MKKIVILSVIVIIVIAFLSLDRKPKINLSQKAIRIGSQELTVETAQTTAQITVGLGNRDSLGSDGMLFVMPVRTIPTFWMKDMRFDLDFVWIDADTVIDITENVSAQQADPDSKLRVYSPRFPVTHVLEMNSGAIQKLGIRIGDRVSL